MAANPLLTDPAIQRLFETLPGARLVGGCVRDSLLSRPGSDIDLATPTPPEQVAAALTKAGIKAVPTGLAHGTVTAVLEGRPFEITTLRRDLQTDGRHAEVAWTDDWQQDAARRDFTINAMSLSPDGVLHDYFGGQADLSAGRVRFVGEAEQRVAEDYLRILRFFRFQARYGAGPADPVALGAIRAGVPGLAQLSAERVWSELKRILAAPDPDEAVSLMAETGVLAAILPESYLPFPLGGTAQGSAGTSPWTGSGGEGQGEGPTPLTEPADTVTPALSQGEREKKRESPRLARLPPDPLLRLAALVPGDPTPVATRLKASLAEIARLSGLRGAPPAGDDDDLRRQLADTDKAALIGRSWLAGQPDSVRERLRALATPKFPLEGRDALALGILPGPRVGDLLRQVRAWWLAGGCHATAEQCRAELARLAAPC